MAPKVKTVAAPADELDLSGQGLTSVPAVVFKTPGLRRLSLADNRLRAMPAKLQQLTSLEDLNLSAANSYGSVVLPPELGELITLRTLDLSALSGTKPSVVPAFVARLPSLRHFRMGTTREPDLAVLEDVAALEVLELSRLNGSKNATRTDAPAPKLGRLRSLRRLVLDRLECSALPPDLGHLVDLEELVLDDSFAYLTHVPDLSSLEKLRVLQINGLALRADHRADPKWLEVICRWHLPSLEVLTLSNWGTHTHPSTTASRPALGRLPEGAFAHMPKLERLDLTGGGLDSKTKAELSERFAQVTG